VQTIEPGLKLFYNNSVELWATMFQSFRKMMATLLEFDLDRASTSRIRTTSTVFWSAHQRFFRQLVLSSKV
jgi:hypothetical protein